MKMFQSRRDVGTTRSTDRDSPFTPMAAEIPSSRGATPRTLVPPQQTDASLVHTPLSSPPDTSLEETRAGASSLNTGNDWNMQCHFGKFSDMSDTMSFVCTVMYMYIYHVQCMCLLTCAMGCTLYSVCVCVMGCTCTLYSVCVQWDVRCMCVCNGMYVVLYVCNGMQLYVCVCNGMYE